MEEEIEEQPQRPLGAARGDGRGERPRARRAHPPPARGAAARAAGAPRAAEAPRAADRRGADGGAPAKPARRPPNPPPRRTKSAATDPRLLRRLAHSAAAAARGREPGTPAAPADRLRRDAPGTRSTPAPAGGRGRDPPRRGTPKAGAAGGGGKRKAPRRGSDADDSDAAPARKRRKADDASADGERLALPEGLERVLVEASLAFDGIAEDVKELNSKLRDVQIQILDQEEHLHSLDIHPDYIRRLTEMEDKHRRKMSAMNERRRLEKARVKEMARMEREETTRWFLEKKRAVRKEVLAELVASIDAIKLERKILRELDRASSAAPARTAWSLPDPPPDADKAAHLLRPLAPLDPLDARTDLGLLRMLTATTPRGHPREPRGMFPLSQPSAWEMLGPLEASVGRLPVLGDALEDVDPADKEDEVERAVLEMEGRELAAVRGMLAARGEVEVEEDEGYGTERSATPELVEGIDLSAWEERWKGKERAEPVRGWEGEGVEAPMEVEATAS